MNHDDLNHWSKRAADWITDYHATLRDRPVRAQVSPGDLLARLPATAPDMAETPEDIFADFEALIPGALTHWQHPRFFAYFPANAAPASMLAEQLMSGIGAQAMLWQTSPAATELEQGMIRWLIRALDMPEDWTGTIHDSATTATLSAVLTMRERALGFAGLTEGLSDQPRLRIYASAQTHSSVDKAVRLAGIGQDNLVKVPTRDDLSMDPDALTRAIGADVAAGLMPAGIVFCAGGTAVGAFDEITACLPVARAHDLMTHVDAAWAGSAMICPEFRTLLKGAEDCDSLVFNPHKWMGAQFDCAVQLIRDPVDQIRTLGLRPRLPSDAGRRGRHQFQRMDRAAGPSHAGAEAVVRSARARAGRHSRPRPQPRRLDAGAVRGSAGRAGPRDHIRAAPVAFQFRADRGLCRDRSPADAHQCGRTHLSDADDARGPLRHSLHMRHMGLHP